MLPSRSRCEWLSLWLLALTSAKHAPSVRVYRGLPAETKILAVAVADVSLFSCAQSWCAALLTALDFGR